MDYEDRILRDVLLILVALVVQGSEENVERERYNRGRGAGKRIHLGGEADGRAR